MSGQADREYGEEAGNHLKKTAGENLGRVKVAFTMKEVFQVHPAIF